MIDHTGLVVSDIAKSTAFYQSALKPLGYEVIMQIHKSVTGTTHVAGFGKPPKPDFWISEGTPNKPIIHIAIQADSKDAVDAFHKAALAAGGTDHGQPGLRPHYHAGYYGAFVLDPDGHNIEAVFHDAT